MAQIKISLPGGLVDGQEIKFKAPCDCTAVTGILVSYYDATGAAASKGFTFRDSLGNDLTGLGSLFAAGAYVKASLDTGNGYAYLLNVTGKVPVSKIDGTITASKIASGAVTTAKIGSGAVTTEKIKDGAVTPAKLSAAIPIEYGGTGATTAASARTALGLGSVAVMKTIPVANGGTGATTRNEAFKNLAYLGANPVTEETDTVEAWKALGYGFAYISGSGVLKDQPSGYGFVYNYTIGGNLIHQVFQSCTNAASTYHRCGEGASWYSTGWVMEYNEHNLNPATLDANGKVAATQASSNIVAITASTTLSASHCGQFLNVNSSSAVTITVPDDSSIPVGAEIEILRYGAGAVTIAAATDMYLRGIGSSASATGEKYKITDRYGVAVLKRIGSATWIISGAVEKV